MVIRPAMLLCLALAAAQGRCAEAPLALSPSSAAPAAAAASLSPAAAGAAVPLTQAAISTSPAFEKNHPTEDFFVVTIISTPFTALWSLLGTAVVAGIAQKQFPPNFDRPTLVTAGSVALGASITIGVLSATWGQGKAPGPASNLSPTKE
jgi:hypothetical protein